MKRLSSFGFVTVPQSSPDSQHASTGKRMRCSAVTETSVEQGQVEQEPAGLSSTSSMVLRCYLQTVGQTTDPRRAILRRVDLL